MSSTLEQIREFTTLGEASVFAVEMMDRGVYKTVRRFSGPIRLPFPKARWMSAFDSSLAPTGRIMSRRYNSMRQKVVQRSSKP